MILNSRRPEKNNYYCVSSWKFNHGFAILSFEVQDPDIKAYKIDTKIMYPDLYFKVNFPRYVPR